MSFLAALTTGLLLWACYPPVNFGALVWLALLPLLSVLWPRWESPEHGDRPQSGAAAPPPRPAWWRPTRAPGAFLHGYLAGATFFLLNLNWLRHVTAPGMVMLALYLALYPALWALFAATVGRPRRRNSRRELARAVVATAAAWTGLEWLRGIALTGFGWNGLGVPLAGFAHGSLAQWAEWIGVTGLSFFIVAPAALLVARWQSLNTPPATPWTRRTPALAVTAASTLAAITALATVGARRARSIQSASKTPAPLTIALIQPNIPQENKNAYESFDGIAATLARLTRQAFDTEPKPDLLVWPESSLPAPFYYEGVQEVLRQGNTLGDFVHVLGIDDQELDAYFNAIAVFRGDPLRAALHHKVHLVPFGEYLPARGLFGRFDFIREQLPGDFKAGDAVSPLPLPPPPLPDSAHITGGLPAPLPAPSFTLIPLVCFEDTLGRVARRFARPEPQLIVNVTNDAWFKDSAGADQHLANAVFRSIELRRPMVRAANTGVTAVIDELGRITHRLPRLREGQLKTTIAQPTVSKSTLYARFGDSFSVALLALAALSPLITRRPPPRETPPNPASGLA